MTVHQDGYIKFVREKIGHELIYLVYAVGIVLDDNGHILVQRRYEFAWWDLVGGAKEINENISECMIREACEESGLEITIEHMVGVYSHPDYTIQYPNGDRVQPWAVCFVCRVAGGAVQPDGKEILEVTFKPLHELLPHPHPIFDRMLRDAFPDGHTNSSPIPALVMEMPFEADYTQPAHTALRQHIKREPIILPGAMMVVFDDVGRMLVTDHAVFDVWDFPGGFSDLGETTTRTAIREVHEETGLEVEAVRALGVYSDPSLMRGEYPNGDVVYGVGLLFEGRVIGGELRADGTESRDVAFLPPEAIAAQPNLRPLTRQILQDIVNIDAHPFIR